MQKLQQQVIALFGKDIGWGEGFHFVLYLDRLVNDACMDKISWLLNIDLVSPDLNYRE